MNLNEFIYTDKEALTYEECDWILEWFNSEKSNYFFDSRKERKCIDCEIDQKNDLFDLLSNSYNTISCNYIDNYPEVLSLYDSYTNFYNDGFLLTKYEKNQGFFYEHIDARFGFTNPRLFATIWYLNDVYDGGKTRFPLSGFEQIPKKGNAIHFPCNWMFPHLGEQPISNDKYIITTFTYAHPYDVKDASRY